jgi:hypothetical protein
MAEERPKKSMSSTSSPTEFTVLSDLGPTSPTPPGPGSSAWSKFTIPPTPGINFGKITSTLDFFKSTCPSLEGDEATTCNFVKSTFTELFAPTEEKAQLEIPFWKSKSTSCLTEFPPPEIIPDWSCLDKKFSERFPTTPLSFCRCGGFDEVGLFSTMSTRRES